MAVLRDVSSRRFARMTNGLRAAAVAFSVLVFALAMVWLPGSSLSDPGTTPASVHVPAPVVTGTSPVEAGRLTSAATRYQAELAAAASAQAARTQAFSTDRTGRRAARLAIIAGGIALLSALLGWVSYGETRLKNRSDAQAVLLARRDDRYDAAITHLTSGEPAAAAAGAYALSDLVESDEGRRLPVLQTLIAFLAERRPVVRLDTDPGENEFEPPIDNSIPIDVVAATIAIARVRAAYSAPPAILPSASLNGYPLAGANFSSARLERGDLSGADLSKSIFRGAVLRRAVLDDAELTGARLQSANLSGAHMSRAFARGADFNGADLSGTILNGTDFTGADLSGATFGGATLTEADLTRTNLTGARFDGVDLSKAVGLGTHPSHSRWLDDDRSGATGNG